MLRGKTAENSNLLRAAEGGSYEEIYVQNILPGPLSILDPPTVKDGLYLDPIPSGDIMDLSYYNIKDLLKSPAFRSALQHGYIRELSRN